MAISPLHILVVEDIENSRETICEMLAVLRHHVCGVATAEEALELLRQRKFDLLLSDINLPGMSGIDLAQAAFRNAPDMKIIFASGFGYLVADKMDFNFVLLPKPYGLAQLAHAIDSVFPPGDPRRE